MDGVADQDRQLAVEDVDDLLERVDVRREPAVGMQRDRDEIGVDGALIGAGAAAITTGASKSTFGSGRVSLASSKLPLRNWSAAGADIASTRTFQRSSCASRPRVPISV